MQPFHGFGIDRRRFLKLGGLAGLGWMTPVGELLAAQAERGREPARSIILLWMAGGPSQLETFDPHPDKKIAGGTRSIARLRRRSSSRKAWADWPR